MFLNSLLLWGAALGLVPILIHLLNRRRHRLMKWAAMEFLLRAVRESMRRLRLRDLVLMLLRTGAVVFLALALARPSLATKKTFWGPTSTAAVILLDNSYSMGCRTGRETRLDAAKRLAKGILAQLEKGTWCAVLTFAHDTRAPLGDPSSNLAYVERELERTVQLSDGNTRLEEALQAVLRLFREHREFVRARKELYLLTDLQARAWNPKHVAPDFPALLEKLSREANILIIDVNEGVRENVAVTGLAPSETLVRAGSAVEFTATIRNTGQADMAGLTVDFHVNRTGAEDGPPADRATVFLPHGEMTSVSFQARFAEGGDHHVEVRLGPDRVAADNRRFCTVEVVEELRFLLADGRPRRPGEAAPGESEYLSFALAPRDPENPDKPPVIAPEVIAPQRLAESDLSAYQVLVLANVARVAPAQAAAIARQVQAGLGLWVLLGDQTDVANYNSALGERGLRLLPAEILEPWGEVPRLAETRAPVFQKLAVQPDRLAHPVMAFFNDEETKPLLEAVRVYRAYGLRPIEAGEVQTVAWLADGRPVVVEREVGLGRVVLVPFPATPTWSNLPLQGHVFTILTQRLAERLSQGNRPAKTLAVGACLRGFLNPGEQRLPLRLTGPAPVGRRQLAPEPLPDGRAFFEFSETDRAGSYEVLLDRPGAKPWLYSVNPEATEEADLTPTSPQALRSDYPGFEFSYVGKSEDLARYMIARGQGAELWPWFFALVLACLLAESVLVRLWAPKV